MFINYLAMNTNFTQSDGLIFGIYPGGWLPTHPESGIHAGDSPLDIPEKVTAALNQLAGDKPFLVRAYQGYMPDTEENAAVRIETHVAVEQYCTDTKKLDLTLCFRPKVYDKTDWEHYIRSKICQYKDLLVKIQITEEPNNPVTAAGGDGSSPMIEQALIDGVIAAKKEAKRLGISLLVGFNAVISFQPEDAFWAKIKQLGTPEFLASLDYVGLDFYPGVFRPLPPNFSMKDAVKSVLQQFRNQNLVAGGIPESIPIHITENGFPTSETRTEDEQADNVKTMVETIYEQRHQLTITHYAFFDLRDANSSAQGFQFGLIRDDYTPKKAFHIFKQLVQQLS